MSFGQSKLGQNEVLPGGCLIIRSKWKGSKLVSLLRDSCIVMFEDRFDYVDIITPQKLAILILEEAELAAESSYRRLVVKLRQLKDHKGMVLVKRSNTIQNFLAIQKFISLDLGLVFIPYNDLDEIGHFLSQFVSTDNNTKSRDHQIASNSKSIDEQILMTLTVIPKLGLAKSKLLLEKFSSLSSICNSSEEELSLVVGSGAAAEIKRFFHDVQLK